MCHVCVHRRVHSCTCTLCVRNKNQCHCKWYKTSLCECVCVCVWAHRCVHSCTCTICENSVRNKNQCHCKWYKPSLCECVCVCVCACIHSCTVHLYARILMKNIKHVYTHSHTHMYIARKVYSKLVLCTCTCIIFHLTALCMYLISIPCPFAPCVWSPLWLVLCT